MSNCKCDNLRTRLKGNYTSVNDTVSAVAEKAMEAYCQGTFSVGGMMLDSEGNLLNTMHNNVVMNNNAISDNPGEGILSGEGCTFIGNSIINNGGTGLYTAHGSLIKDNTVSRNASHGIWATSNCFVSGNLCKKNTDAGIYCQTTSSVVEFNVLAKNGTGIKVDQPGNYIANNKLTRNTLSFSTVSGNFIATGDNANIIYYFSANGFMTRITGFDVPSLRESPQTILRNLRW